MTLSYLPSALYTAEQTRALDRIAIEGGTPGFTLMKRAAHAAFAHLRKRWSSAKSLTVICGRGNNGGDGLVLAALAVQQSYSVQVVTVGKAPFNEQLRGEALEAYNYMLQYELVPESYYSGMKFEGEVVVDALLGTGIKGAVSGVSLEVIEQINQTRKPVLAVDIPSGLCADTGGCLGVAVRANLTVTFIGLKRGLFTHQAVDFTGDIFFDGLRVDESVYDEIAIDLFRTHEQDLNQRLGKRARSAHKGSHGHVLVVGGDKGMGGAALMAVEAAAKAGAGLVSLATQAEHVTASLVRCPEVMVHGVKGATCLDPLIDRADIIVIGPGLGQSAWSQQLLMRVMASDKSKVVDADALNMMANGLVDKSSAKSNWVLTPHPGEASRLAGCSVAEIQSDRFKSVKALQEQYGGVVLLKGAGTLVTDHDVTYLCNAGNPGMAVGGMGDLLSGIIAGLVAQKLPLIEAARLGAYLHASAADRVVERRGERGLLATDLLEQLPYLLNGIENE